jgi:hypothetical protein
MMQLKEQTTKMKEFNRMKNSFVRDNVVSDMKYFNIDKKFLIEIEDYIERLKLMHSNVFRKSLNVPSKTKALNQLQEDMKLYLVNPKKKVIIIIFL